MALDRGRAPSQYVLDHWSHKDGLRQHRVAHLRRTRDGFLWLATEDGLVRFDGAGFQTFSSSTPGFGHHYVFSVMESDDGELWVGTYAGLTQMRGGTFTTHVSAGGPKAWHLARDRSCPFWVAGYVEGLSCFEDGRWTPNPSFAGRRVMALLGARDGSLWVATADAVHHVEGDAVTVYDSRHGLPRNASITSLAEGARGVVWIGTSGGLARLVGGQVSVYTTAHGLTSNLVQAVLEDRDGNVWAGTAAGLNRLQGNRVAALTRRDGLVSDDVSALHEDADGSLWIGTTNGGLSRLRDGPFITYGTSHGLAANVVWSMYESAPGTLWVGTQGGLNRIEVGAGVVVTLVPGVPEASVHAVARGRDGGLWLGMNVGLARWRAGRVEGYGSRHGLPGVVRAILEDSRGRLWVGTGDGLYRREGERFVRVPPPPGASRAHAFVPSIFEDRDGSVWFGTDDGLWRLQGESFTAYSTADGLPGTSLRVLLQEADGTLWVSANPGGLGRLRAGRWSVVGPGSGLLDERVHAAVEDHRGHLWLSGDRAIYRVAKDDLHAVADGQRAAVRSFGYDPQDGLRVTEGNGGHPGVFRSADGRIWFATAGGAAVVDPADLHVNDVPPPVYIEELVVDDTRVVTGDSWVPPGRGKLEFHYTAPSLRVPDRVHFRYRLEGFDTEWIDAGSRRTATYTNMPPGTYRFQVQASNEDGVWNERGASLAFSLAPHWYQTTAARLLATAGLLAGGFGIHRLRVRRLQTHIQEAVAQIKVLRGLLPICSGCKKIRDDGGYWNRIESYVQEHTYAEFSHGICPDCYTHLYPEYADGTRRNAPAPSAAVPVSPSQLTPATRKR